MTNKHYDTNLNSYNESEALQQLFNAASDALDNINERIESDSSDAWYDQFTITVGGVQTAFILGGTQYQALIDFIRSIADENFHDVGYIDGAADSK